MLPYIIKLLIGVQKIMTMASQSEIRSGLATTTRFLEGDAAPPRENRGLGEAESLQAGRTTATIVSAGATLHYIPHLLMNGTRLRYPATQPGVSTKTKISGTTALFQRPIQYYKTAYESFKNNNALLF